jgi:hypothetical protein
VVHCRPGRLPPQDAQCSVLTDGTIPPPPDLLEPGVFPLVVPPGPALPDADEDAVDVAGLAGEHAATETVTTKAAGVATATATLRENDMVSILPPRMHNFCQQDATGLVTGHHSTGRDP